MTVAEWNALSLGPLAGKRERKEVQKRFSTWKASVEFTRTLNLVETGVDCNFTKQKQASPLNVVRIVEFLHFPPFCFLKPIIRTEDLIENSFLQT